jgi:hypothetical protein
MGRRRTVQEWQALVTGQAASGLSVAAYCERERISRASFHRWRAQAAAAVTLDAGGEGVADAQPRAAFVDLGALRERSSRLELRLDLGEGWVLQIARG